VSVRILSQTPHHFKSLMTSTSFGTVGAGVGFINNDKFGAGTLEFFSPAIGFNIVHRDDYEGITFEK